MFITYRRTGGLCALVTFAAVALAATVLTVAVAAAMLVGALAVGAAALLARAVLPTRSRHHTVPPTTQWPRETIEARVVKSTTGSSDERDLIRMDSDKG